MIKTEELSNPNSCLNKACDDELVFVLLERDPAAPEAIRAWVNERLRLGKNKTGDPQIQEAMQCVVRMKEKQAVRDNLVKFGQAGIEWESK